MFCTSIVYEALPSHSSLTEISRPGLGFSSSAILPLFCVSENLQQMQLVYSPLNYDVRNTSGSKQVRPLKGMIAAANASNASAQRQLADHAKRCPEYLYKRSL
jgi:hypothetical protein